MVSNAQKQSSVVVSSVASNTGERFVFTLIGLTILAIFTTATIGYLVTSPPRGFMFWIAVGFLCTIEFLTGILAVNIYALARCQYRPSSAVLAITYVIVGVYAASGLLTIIVYSTMQDPEGSRDGFFIAILMGITVFWFIIAALLYAYDLHSQTVTRPSSEERAEHRRYGRSLSPILSAIRAVKTNDTEHRNRLEIISKKLEVIDVALSHSSGGGLGSWETGRSQHSKFAQDQVIQDSIGMMEKILPRLSTYTPSDTYAAMTEFEQCVARVASAVEALGLQ